MKADDGVRFTHKETGKKIYHFVRPMLVHNRRALHMSVQETF
jgi:hypothetical protein